MLCHVSTVIYLFACYTSINYFNYVYFCCNMQYHTIHYDINWIFLYFIFIYNLPLFVMPPHTGPILEISVYSCLCYPWCWVNGHSVYTYEYSNEQSVKCESFFVLACYVDEATLTHVWIQGRNTTKKTMTCNFWYRHS